MIFVWALILAAAAVSNADAAAARIIGGSPTSIEQYPSTVQVEFRNVFLWWNQECAGTILTPRHVMSVARCFTGFLFIIEQRRIRCGTSVRDQNGITYSIQRAYNHPTYRNGRNEGDITILLLDNIITFDATMQPALIPPQDFNMFEGAPVTIVGWGTTRQGGGGSASSQLQSVGINTINIETCRLRHNEVSNEVSDTMLCGGVLDGDSMDACEGDEGGPMLLSNNIVLGIISWGHTCGDTFFPRVFTKVSAFSDWISETISTTVY